MPRLASCVAAVGALGALGSAAATVTTTPASLSVFLLGLAQGIVLSSVIFFLFVRQSSPSPPPATAAAVESTTIRAIASPRQESEKEINSKTPRGLLKNLSATPKEEAMPTALALPEPRSTRASSVVAEVEYTLEEYETLKKQNKKQKKTATPSTPAAAPPPPPTAPPPEETATETAARPTQQASKLPTSRRKSLRTPKPSARYAEDA